MVTGVLDKLIKQYLSQEYAERTKSHLEEASELSQYVFLSVTWIHTFHVC